MVVLITYHIHSSRDLSRFCSCVRSGNTFKYNTDIHQCTCSRPSVAPYLWVSSIVNIQ